MFSCVFASVSEACFKYFICLQTYVASVASRCLESRSGVAHVVIRVRSGGDASGPHAQCGGAGDAGPAWARETQEQVGHAVFLASVAWIAGASMENCSTAVRTRASGWTSGCLSSRF